MPIDNIYIFYGLWGIAIVLIVVNVWLVIRLSKIKGFEKLSHQVDDVLRDMEDVKWRLESLEVKNRMILLQQSGAVRCLSRCKRTSEWFHLGFEQERYRVYNYYYK